MNTYAPDNISTVKAAATAPKGQPVTGRPAPALQSRSNIPGISIGRDDVVGTVEPNRSQQIARDAALIKSKEYFSSIGKPFSEPEIYFVTPEKISAAEGRPSNVQNTILVDAAKYADPRYLCTMLIYECMRSNSGPASSSPVKTIRASANGQQPPSLMTKEEAENEIRESFNRVLVPEFKNKFPDLDIYLNDRVLEQYSNDIAKGSSKISLVEELIRRDIYDRNSMRHASLDPTPMQLSAKTNAATATKEYSASIGIPFSEPAVFFIPPENMNRKTTAGFWSEFLGSIFISSKITDSGYLGSIISHEYFHSNSESRLPYSLNEGATQYFTIRSLMAQRGIAGNSFMSVMDAAEKIYSQEFGSKCPIYHTEVAIIAALADRVGEKAIIDAYFKGQEDPIEKAIGKEKWQQIKELSGNSEHIDSNKLAPLFHAILSQ